MAEEVSGENEPEAPNAALAINLIGAQASKLSGTSTTKRKYVDSFSDDFKGSNPCPSPKVSSVFLIQIISTTIILSLPKYHLHKSIF